MEIERDNAVLAALSPLTLTKRLGRKQKRKKRTGASKEFFL